MDEEAKPFRHFKVLFQH